MNVDSFVLAIEKEKPAPCQKFDCELKEKCAAGHLACSSFVHYVRTGQSRSPRMQTELDSAGRIKTTYKDQIEANRDYFLLSERINEVDVRIDSDDVIAHAILNRTDLDMVFLPESRSISDCP